jgi:hypothetical protein
MPQPVKATIREALLSAIEDQAPTSQIGASLQQNSILIAVEQKLGRGHDEAILTQWGDLFRTGLLAWGLTLSNPNPPFFHLTERGRTALENLTRDPSNPAGYLRHLASIAAPNPIAISYLTEALDCYVAGLFKAGAVMVGGAAESVILDLRDATCAKLKALGRPVPKGMEDWRIKTVSDALRSFFEGQNLPRDLREPFDAYWSAFAQQIRSVRNDVGHPVSVDPVTPDTVHASLLIFPELARLAASLERWVINKLV